ncbi:MAG: hypothetical protein EOP88_18240 [Verrucomicrobiaceae bacterium]|nr:MAG: hypothetical protein EOP88_18240 [Verrucomicrobiaceae bacterium]
MTGNPMESSGDLPHNPAVFITRQVLDGEEPILAVYHDAGGDWQFIGATGGNDENGRTISLENAMNMDPALRQLPDLPPTFYAVRKDAISAWKRHRIPGTLKDDPWGLDSGVTANDPAGSLLKTILRKLR